MLLAVLLAGCDPQPEVPELRAQEAAVARAEEALRESRVRLDSLQDGLSARVREDVEMGMSEAVADSAERKLVRGQLEVVKAASENLARQKEYLQVVRKTGRLP